MKTATTNEHRIEAYLLDAMSIEERTRFSEELKMNPMLAHEIELQRAAYAAAEASAEDRVIDSMSKWEWKHSLPWKLFPLVALATTVVGIALLYLAWKYWPRPHDYFAEHYEAFEGTRPGNPSPAEASFFAGLSCLEAEPVDADCAVRELTTASLSSDPIKPQAEWYLAMAYFAAGDESKGQAIVKVIAADPKHPRQADAADAVDQATFTWLW